MRDVIRRLLVPPDFDDVEKTRVARILNVCLWVVLIGAGIFGLTIPFVMPERMSRMPIVIGVCTLSAGMLYVVRTGRVRFAALCFTSALWLIFSYAALTSGGIEQPGFTLQIVVVVIAALTLGGRTALAFAGLSALFGLGMYLAQEAGSLPTVSTFSLTSSAVTQIVAMLTIALLLNQTAQSINQAFDRSRQAEKVLAERNRLLEVEIMERKRVETELRDSQTRLREAQLIADIGSWESDLLTGKEIWSEETTRHLGFNPGEVEPTFELFLSHVHPDDRHLHERKPNQKLEKGNIQYRIVLADSSIRHIASRAEVRVDGDGRVTRLVGITQNITTQKESERALIESEEQLRLATDGAHIGIWDWNIKTGSVRWNDQTYQIFGLTREDFAGSLPAFHMRVHPDDMAVVQDILKRADENGVMEIGDFRIYHADGSLRWVYERGKVYYNAAGEPERVIGITQDITERKKSEQALRDQTEILQAIFDHIPMMVVVSDANQNVKLVNRAWESTLGWPLAELLVRNDLMEHLYPDPVQRQRASDAIREAASIWSDFTTTARDGQIVDTAWANLRLSNGMAISIGHDVTERKRAEQQRLELAVEKERVELLKEFIGNMSHDLKTPLTLIKTSLYLFERMSDPERQKQRMDAVHQQVLLLERLIEDILTMSQLDHTPELTLAGVDLNRVLHDVENKLRPAAETKQLQTLLELDQTAPPILANESELYRVMFNLIENAIKYTPNTGLITIRTRCDGKTVITEVVDTGIGIGADELPHIFDRFFRADRARTIDIPGTGLGLAIVKRIVEMHNGTIDVDSTLGQGSVFRVRLPMVD
jgi:PAS domain S-box-containing protein